MNKTKISASAKFLLRSDTLENWEAENPVLEKGELCAVETESGDYMLKIGNGKSAFKELGGLLSGNGGAVYEKISINSFTASPNKAEIGSTVNTVTLNWTLNKDAKSLKLNGTEIGLLTSRSEQLTDLGLTQDTSWTLVATDESDAKASKTVTLSFLKGIYYGVASADAEINSDLIQDLTCYLQPQANINQSFTVTTSTDKRIFFALPTSDYNAPVFEIGGFDYTWEKVTEFEFTNASGHTESYTVWRSAQAVADTITVTAKAIRK